jgi:hypothetical protein
MWLRRVALALGVVAVVLLLASGPGVRLGLWHYSSGFLLLRVAAYVGLAAAVLALAGLVRRKWRAASLGVALVLGLGAAAGPLEFQRRARSAPLINDVSTAVDLKASPGEAFARASAAARDMGWEVAAADPAAGRIEAVATTFWFGFRDDVTVRVAPQEAGSRVEVRSKSRVGRGDAGTNARRVRDYLKRLE